jgi:hypothetical protein
VIAAVVAALGVLGFALWWGGGVTPVDRGVARRRAVDRVGLPVVRLLVDGGAMLTAGWCVVAAFLLPGAPRRGDGQLLGPAAAVVALLACVACPTPALTGHSAGAGNHQLAVTSLAVHILAVSLWIGGLADRAEATGEEDDLARYNEFLRRAAADRR